MIFTPEGGCRFIYDDRIAEIAPGPLNTKRASHVEPNDQGMWTADMSPVGGPLLGPFGSRQSALCAETAWLKAHDIPLPK
jgi:hypothetical protein